MRFLALDLGFYLVTVNHEEMVIGALATEDNSLVYEVTLPYDNGADETI